MALAEKTIENLKSTQLYDETSLNVLKININRYRVSGRGNRVALSVVVPFGQYAAGPDLLVADVTLKLTEQPNDQNAIFPVSASKVYSNQYRGGENNLAIAFLRELNLALSCFK